MKICSLEQAIRALPISGNVFVQGACATPKTLLEGLTHTYDRFRELTLIHMHTQGDAAYAEPMYRGHFRVMNLFLGPNIRKRIDYDRVDYLPCFLSEMPALFRRKVLALEAALIQVTPPDQHGYCSLGTSVDIVRAAVENAKLVVAQINPNLPRTFGDGIIHVSQIHLAVETDHPIYESPVKMPSEEELAIGRHVAGLVEDEATLQVGIGAIPDAVLGALGHHKNLGIHTEMWSDAAIPLMETGVITNTKKKIHPGKTVSTFVSGTKKLFQFIDNNPSVLLLDAAYVNNPTVIAKNPKVTAINSAVEIDLSGQVCADSVGSRIISGVGGQMDFMRGAALSENGKPIIAITSRTKKGESKISPVLRLGAGVVTTRAHVHFVATEYGVIDLFGKSLHQRARALIEIAHPDDRESLDRAWHGIMY